MLILDGGMFLIAHGFNTGTQREIIMKTPPSFTDLYFITPNIMVMNGTTLEVFAFPQQGAYKPLKTLPPARQLLYNGKHPDIILFTGQDGNLGQISVLRASSAEITQINLASLLPENEYPVHVSPQ